MGFINREKFVELLTDGTSNDTLKKEIKQCTRPSLWDLRKQEFFYHKDELIDILEGVEINREGALKVYDLAKQHLVSQGYFNYKQLRPWEFVNPIETLDRSQPWWGFEFETGYTSQEALSSVIEHVWNTWDNVAFDREGEGSFYSEITFTPQEMSTYLDGTADAYQFMQYLDGCGVCNNTGESNIGTHINISLPDVSAEGIANICNILNNTLHMLPQDGTREKLFGRERLYEGCHPRSNGDQPYLEGKLFRTTYSIEQFKGYVQVCRALTTVAAACFNNADIQAYCSNFLAVVADSTVVPTFDSSYSLTGDWDGWYVSGDEEEEYHYYEEEEEEEVY